MRPSTLSSQRLPPPLQSDRHSEDERGIKSSYDDLLSALSTLSIYQLTAPDVARLAPRSVARCGDVFSGGSVFKMWI